MEDCSLPVRILYDNLFLIMGIIDYSIMRKGSGRDERGNDAGEKGVGCGWSQ